MVFWTEPAQAQKGEGSLLLQIDTQYQRTQDSTQVRGLRDAQVAGLSIDANGRMGTGRIAHSAYIDAHFGAGLQGGFAYRFALLPLGFALYDKRQLVILNVASGLMLSGVTAHEPLGVLAPLRVSLISRLGDHVLLNAWAASDFALRKSRRGTPEHAPFGDELRAGITLRAGSSGTMNGRKKVTFGNGYFVGVLYAERFKTAFWGLTIGHGMNMRGG
jgi:hypothetical protein